MPNSKTPLPVHSLSRTDFPVLVRRIEHKNPYDFTSEHRHTYFEIFFFETGGGSQLIDFIELPVKESSSYIVFPQQVHLLKRAPTAIGRLVQFGEEIIDSAQIKLLLQQLSFDNNPAVLFEKDADKISKLGVILELMESVIQQSTAVSNEILKNYLNVLLLQLLDFRTNVETQVISGDRELLFQFQKLLEEQYLHNHLVSSYCSLLNTTDKKLASSCKKFLGLSPLQVIHNRILLEAKRMLLFESTSHKEIAFHLGFDSPASFSLFIKNKTGHNPSELNTQLVNIHK